MNPLWAVLPSSAAAESSGLTSVVEVLGKFRNSVEGIDRQAWANMTFKERLFAYNWTLELCVLGTVVLFLLSFFHGRRSNKSLVDKFYAAIKPILDDQFAYVGCKPGTPIIKDGDSRYTTYASGRVNVESLLARFRLKERQSIMTMATGLLIPSLSSADGLGDHVEIEITPINPAIVEPGIFGVIHKESLQEIQDEYFFEKFAKIVDSDLLPSPLYTLMYEHSDLNALYVPSFKDALALPGSEKVFRSFVFSDMINTEPTKVEDVGGHPKLHLSLNFPRSYEESFAVASILSAALDVADQLVEKEPYRASTSKRIKATREAEVSRILKKEEAAKKEELELKRAEERREAARRESTLSEKEQRKRQKKENEKQARKQRQRMTRRN